MAVQCKQVLETALGRQISDNEFALIERDFKAAQAEVGREIGKGFNTLPKEQKAQLIADKLNLNRSKALTNIEAQLLADNKISDLTIPLRSTLGSSIDDISALELADNINNMIGSTTTRTNFLRRGGNRVTYDTAIATINNKIWRTFRLDYLPDFTKLTDKSGLVKNDQAERELAERIVNTNYLDKMFDSLNAQYAAAGMNNKVNKLDIGVSRDDLVHFNRNNGNVEDAAIAFEAKVAPLVKDNNVNLRELYKDLIYKKDALESEVGVITTLNDLKFKDGESLLTFLRDFSSTKDLVTHVAGTINNTSRKIAAKRVFGDDDIVAILTTKLENPNLSSKERRRLKGAIDGYKEVTGLTTRDYTKGVLDLGIDLVRIWVRTLWLGKSALKGYSTDRIHTSLIGLSRGDVKGTLNYNVDSIANIAKSDQDLELFYGGMDEMLAGAQHYLNVGNQGILAQDSFVTNALQRGIRKGRNLSSNIQSAQGQNWMIKAQKRAVGSMIEKQIFSKTWIPELADSINPITYQRGQQLELTNIRDLYDLDVTTYNTKMGTKVDDIEFAQIKADLELEFEGAIMHQVQGTQIDSGSISVTAQNARLFGESNNAFRRYVLPLAAQFQGYGQNFLLKSNLIRGLLSSDTLAGKIKYGSLFLAMMVGAGYSNINVNNALKDKYDAEYDDPYTDLVEGNYKQLISALIGGSSLPLTKNAEGFFRKGEIFTAPGLVFIYKLNSSIYNWTQDPSAENVGAIQQAAIGANLPGLYELLEFIKSSYGGEK